MLCYCSYHPRIRRGNMFSRVCLYNCSAWAGTFEGLDLVTSLLVPRYISRLSTSSSYIEVIGSSWRLQQQKLVCVSCLWVVCLRLKRNFANLYKQQHVLLQLQLVCMQIQTNFKLSSLVINGIKKVLYTSTRPCINRMMQVQIYPTFSIESGSRKFSECVNSTQPPNKLHITTALAL